MAKAERQVKPQPGHWQLALKEMSTVEGGVTSVGDLLRPAGIKETDIAIWNLEPAWPLET